MYSSRFTKRLLPLVLSLILLFTSMPVSALSIETEQIEIAPQIVSEVVERREESVKHFLCDDGSYIAATYSSPVHYLEDGEWKEIDNSLELGAATYGTDSVAMYTTAASANPVSLPQSFANGQRISMSHGDYTVSFGVANSVNAALSAVAEVVAPSTLPSAMASDRAQTELQNMSVAEPAQTKAASANITAAQQAELDNARIKAHNESAMAVENQSGAIVYEDIFPGADLEYIVSSNMVKENIVVSAPQTSYAYTFNMDLDGLVPVEQPNGSILLTENGTTDTAVFIIQAPYMYDASGTESIAVEMALIPSENGYTLSLTADSAWINSPERTFPVVIDPTFGYLETDIQDVYVMDGIYDDSNKMDDELRVGRNLTNLGRIYLMVDEPLLVPADCAVTQAYLVLQKKTYYQAPSQDDISLKIYDCEGVVSWVPTTITWNNQPFNTANNGYASDFSSAPLSTVAAASSKSVYEFDITTVMQRIFHSTADSARLFIASSDENSKTHIRFHSTRATDYTNYPDIICYYEPVSISIDEWNPAASGASQNVTLVAPNGWNASSNQSWLTVSDKTTESITNNSFKLTAAANTAEASRTATVTITAPMAFGTQTIGTITVTQYGTEPTLNIVTSNNNWVVKSGATNLNFTVSSNVEWSFSAQSEKATTPSWFNVEKNGSIISVELNENVAPDPAEDENGELVPAENPYNFGYEARKVTITVTSITGESSDTITITQLDPVSDYFNSIDANGVASQKSSTEYNHPLATWAMELSYKAYNPIRGLLAHIVPGLFMGGVTEEASTALISNGFSESRVETYNYELDEVVAHTIAYREITCVDNLINNEGGLNNVGSNIVTNTSTAGITGIHNIQNSGTVSELLNNTENNKRPLVAVVIRGSVSIPDWVMDVSTSVDAPCDQFIDGKNMIMQSLFTGTGDTVNCENEECENGCPLCMGYITYYNLENPIILVTGHSLGAAVANLTAAALSSCDATENVEDENGEITTHACNCHEGTHRTYSEEDIYAYTFATPETLNYSKHTNANAHSNIFNIMNNNDVIPFIIGGSDWQRHGRDIFITMLMDIRWLSCVETSHLGLGGHAMPTYLSWLESFAENWAEPADQIELSNLPTTNDSEPLGLLPKLFKIKCPVNVTINNADGQPVAFVTSQTGETGQCGTVAMDGSGIVAWTDTNGAKYIMLPYGYGEVTAEIEAYASGTMDISVETAGLGVPINRTVRSQLPVSDGAKYEVGVPANLGLQNATVYSIDPTTQARALIETLSPYLHSAEIKAINETSGSDTSIVPVGTANVFTFVTADNVQKVQLINPKTGSTKTLDERYQNDELTVTDNNDGTLTWVYTNAWTKGNRIFDIGVKFENGYVWYVTDRVLRQVVYTPE